MDKLIDYVKIYKIDDVEFADFVTENVASIKDAEWTQHQWFGYNGPVDRDNKKELSTYYPKSAFAKRKWREYNSAALDKYLKDMPYETSLYGISDVRYNKYEVNTQMLRHHDHIRSLFDGMKKGIPILTVIAALNPKGEYTGGEFVFDNFDTEIRLDMGEIMVFPSVFLYEHHVNEVTSGKRFAAVSWAF